MGGVAAETGQPTGTDVERGAPPRRATWPKRSRSPMRARLGSGARRAPSHTPRVGPSCPSVWDGVASGQNNGRLLQSTRLALLRGDAQLASSLSGPVKRSASPGSTRSVSSSSAWQIAAKGALEFWDVERADERRRDGCGHLRRKVVHAAALDRGHAVAQARQGEHLISHRADHVLRLPHPAAGDARPGVQRIEPAQADQLNGGRRSRGERLGDGTEQQAKARPDRAELRLCPERDIDLQRAGKQEDPIDRLASGRIQVMTTACSLYIRSVQSAIAGVRSASEARHKAISMSDQRSSRPSAEDPSSAAALMRASARATETSSSRSRSRSSALNTMWTLLTRSVPTDWSDGQDDRRAVAHDHGVLGVRGPRAVAGAYCPAVAGGPYCAAAR